MSTTNTEKKPLMPSQTEAFQLTVGEILESNEFEKNLAKTVNGLVQSRLQAGRELDYGQRLKRTPISRVLELYGNNLPGLTIEFIKILGKQSKLPSALRTVVTQIVEPELKRTAMELINKKQNAKQN